MGQEAKLSFSYTDLYVREIGAGGGVWGLGGCCSCKVTSYMIIYNSCMMWREDGVTFFKGVPIWDCGFMTCVQSLGL